MIGIDDRVVCLVSRPIERAPLTHFPMFAQGNVRAIDQGGSLYRVRLDSGVSVSLRAGEIAPVVGR